MAAGNSIYTRTFWLLCLSSVLFFSSFNFIIAELPDHLTKLGGASYKGMIIWLFTLAALISRPFSGRLADRVGRMPVIIVGVVVCLIAGFLYPLLSTVWGFFMLRFLHGFSTGFKPTGTAAYVADIIPIERRGEAMGILGLCNALGTSLGPLVGSEIALRFSMDAMFYCSSGVALLSIAILMGLPETLKDKQKLNWQAVAISKNDIIEPRALVPFLIMIAYTYSFGLVLTVLPDLSKHLGLANKGAMLAIITLSSLLVRIFAGRVSDRKGRAPVMAVGMLFLITGMSVIALSNTVHLMVIGLILYGFGAGINSPSIMAWTIDLSRPEQRGRAIAFLYIGLEIGIGFGALISGWLHGSNPDHFGRTFFSGAIMGVIGLIVIGLRRNLLPKDQR